MIELPGWNDLISVNGFCYSSSMGESPKLNIPLKTSTAPTKGIAPNIFTRNSTATYIDDGILQTAGVDTPRFQNGRYLCEPTATNLVFYSQDLSQWNNTWGGGVNITSGYTIAGLPAFKIKQVDSLDDAIYANPILTLTAGSKYYVSLFIKNVDSLRFNIGIYDSVKVTFSNLRVSFTNGIPSTYSNPTTITEIVYTALAGEGEYLLSFAYTVLSGSSTHRVFIYPETSRVATNSIIVTGLQVATILTSYIPTTSATVTRAADALHYAVGDVITQGQGSLYCEFWDGNVSGPIRVVFSLSDNTTNNKIWLLIDATGKLRVNIKLAGTNIMYSAITSLSSMLNKVLITYQDNLSKIYVNGVLIETDTTCIIPVGLSKLHIGVSETATYVLNSEVGNIKYFKEVLTEAEAIKLTTL